jgi:hypothetical protein
MGIRPSLNQTCDLYAPTVAANGLQSYPETATYSSVACRIEASSRQFRNEDGTVGLASMVGFFGADVTVTRGYKLATGGVSYLVERVDAMRGLASLSHYELICTEL